MLQISKRRSRSWISFGILAGSVTLLAGGLYLLTLVATPIVVPYLPIKKIDVAALPQPKVGDNRIIIPKINVDIPYGLGKYSLDTGAQWRWPERGSPVDGGNFIIAAHRFSLAATPQMTLVKSPFYHIDKLIIGDEIVIDYSGKRYSYTITKIYDVKPDQTEIEAPSKEAKLTLYSCTLGGSADGRVVVEAKLADETSASTE